MCVWGVGEEVGLLGFMHAWSFEIGSKHEYWSQLLTYRQL